MGIPPIEVLQVVFSALGTILCLCEWYDAHADVRESREADDDPTLCFAAVAARREEAILFMVHVAFFLSGIYVMIWRLHHPDIVAITVRPSVTRNGAILWATLWLAALSYWHRYNRQQVRAMGQAAQARKRAPDEGAE